MRISNRIRQIFSGKLQPRHQPSACHWFHNETGTAFPDYIAASRAMLQDFHRNSPRGKARPELVEALVNGNAPFEFWPPVPFPAGKSRPYRRGVLLIHGLSDSPYYMRHLGEFFRDQGFRVMAVLLPGHGTQPGDLLNAHWKQWADTVAYGAECLAREVDEMFLAGYSIGGALSIRHGLLDDRIKGMFLFSPALRISPLADIASIHKLYSWLFPAGKWKELKPDIDLYKYESFPLNAAIQIAHLEHDLKRLMAHSSVQVPVFVAASEDDTTVDIDGTLDFIARVRHSASRMRLYTTRPGRKLPGFSAQRLQLVSSVYPAQRILSIAHAAVVISPDDAHYGAAGTYANCVHYLPEEPDKYVFCMDISQPADQGELTEQNLNGRVLRRLMYNPDFSGMLEAMKDFLRHVA